MRHDETPKVDEMDVHLSKEHYCPPLPQTPPRRGTTFLNARPEDYVTEEFDAPKFARPTVNGWFKKFFNFEYAINPLHVLGVITGWFIGHLIW